MRLTDDNIRGRTILTSDGHVVGEVRALYLDARARRVESLKVKLTKNMADELGAERSILHAGEAEIPVLMVRSIEDTVMLAIPLSGLRGIFARLSDHESNGLIERPADTQPPVRGDTHGI